ncbi:MAG TPA: HNH endonuclease signature motif containing protein [Candidatus Baltobacteraceae bacterium]|nr:HNH endonuclease signature motif containing protein [Candidatus Baltobacteraceae bacterium]
MQRFHDRGHGRDACVEQFGFTIGAWYKAIRFRRLRAPLQRPSVDWAAVQVYYDGGHTYRECRARFGFAAASWTKAVRRGALRARRNRWPLMKVLGQAKNRRTVKQHLFAAGLLENVCSVCGLSEWQGKPLVIQLDHINGVRNDHRLENLRMLCPNCHSQTDTFAARNKARRVRTF